MKISGFQNKKNLLKLENDENWTLYEFNKILIDDTKNAKKIKTSEYKNEGKYPIIDQGKNYISGYSNDGLGLYKNMPCIIFGDHTKILKYIDFPIYIGADGVKVLKLNEEITENSVNIKYLYYFLKTIDLPNEGYSRHFKYLKQIIIPIPSIEIQNKVVHILEKSSSVIVKRKQQIKILDELVESIFNKLFGDPGKNPKNWEIGTIKDILVDTYYGTSDKADETEGEYSILRMNNITYEGSLDFSNLKYINLSEQDKLKYLVYKGEVLFNRTNSKELVGKTAEYKEEEPMAYAGYLVKMTPNEKANGTFISAYLNTKYSKQTLYNMAKNIVGMANINAEELKRIKVYIPPIELQNQFAEIVNRIEKEKELLKQSLEQLETNFKALEQKAFNGELFN